MHPVPPVQPIGENMQLEDPVEVLAERIASNKNHSDTYPVVPAEDLPVGQPAAVSTDSVPQERLKEIRLFVVRIVPGE